MRVTISFERKTTAELGATAISAVHVSVKDARGYLTYENLVRAGECSAIAFELPEQDGRTEQIEIATTCIT